jgi:hypothetical protein
MSRVLLLVVLMQGVVVATADAWSPAVVLRGAAQQCLDRLA